MRILGLSSSPRLGGNTDLLLDHLLRGAQEAGAAVEKIRLAELAIRPCTQCDACRRDGLCPIPDDMRLLYPKLLDTDALVLAAPIYFMAHCAQAKLLIDRCQAFWARRHVLKQSLAPPSRPPRRGLFISVGATHGPQVFAGAQVTMRWFFDALQMEYWHNLLFEGIDERGRIQQHPTALRDAYETGRRLALP